jgi:hypothetical protein
MVVVPAARLTLHLAVRASLSGGAVTDGLLALLLTRLLVPLIVVIVAMFGDNVCQQAR